MERMASQRENRARARELIAAARAPGARRGGPPSGVSVAVGDGEQVAIYAAPVERLGVEPQGALGAGSVTDDLLSGRGALADRDALDSALGALPGGIYDVTIRLQTGDPRGRSTQERTEVRSVVISDADTPEERGARVTRVMQGVARDVVKEDSSARVRIGGAVLSPEGMLGMRQRIGEPVEAPEQPTRPARRRPTRKPTRKAPARKPTRKLTRKAPARKPAPKPTRKPAARKPLRDALGRFASKPKPKPKRKPAKKGKSRR